MNLHAEQPKLKDRDSKIMMEILKTGRKGGNVLIPTDSSGPYFIRLDKIHCMGGLNGEAPLGMWALRKEARRHMYETSTDQVRVHRRGLGSSSSSSVAAMCQKCLRRGHWSYECKNGAVYVQRPSRSQQLRNPKLRQPFNKEMPPELLIQEEVKLKAEKSKKLKLHIAKSKKKETSSGSRSLLRRKRRSSVSSSSSSSDSSSSDSSDSDSDSLGSDRVSSTSSSENDRSSRSFKRKRRD